MLIPDGSEPPNTIRYATTESQALPLSLIDELRILASLSPPRNTSQTPITSIQASYTAPQSTGSSIFGPTFYYPFSTSFPSSTGISAFSTGANSVTGEYPVDDRIFWVPGLSGLEGKVDEEGRVGVNVTAAVRRSLFTKSALAKSLLTFSYSALSVIYIGPIIMAPHQRNRNLLSPNPPTRNPHAPHPKLNHPSTTSRVRGKV